MNAALSWLILMGLYTCAIEGGWKNLEYTSNLWKLNSGAGWKLGNDIYRTWYCVNVAKGFLR